MAALAEVTKRTDEAIRKVVRFELQWDPKLADCVIAVAVNDVDMVSALPRSEDSLVGRRSFLSVQPLRRRALLPVKTIPLLNQ
jgi:hypothetical protein